MTTFTNITVKEIIELSLKNVPQRLYGVCSVNTHKSIGIAVLFLMEMTPNVNYEEGFLHYDGLLGDVQRRG